MNEQTPLEILSQDYRRIERAVRFIADHRREQPGLDDIAQAAHVSPYHFQRLFTRWAGVSPKRFLGYLTMEHARSMLEGAASVLDASLESGLSGPGRLHDLFINFEAVSPGDIKRRGEGLVIRYGSVGSPFGPALVGLTDRGICRLTFLTDGSEAEAMADLSRRWPAAELVRAPAEAQAVVDRIFHGPVCCEDGKPPLRLHVTGTNFQIKVWEAALRLPLGRLATYSQIGAAIGHPKAARAVGNALHANPVAFVIPCHAVVPMLRQATTSLFAPYQSGGERRAAMIGWEAAQIDQIAPGLLPENSYMQDSPAGDSHAFDSGRHANRPVSDCP